MILAAQAASQGFVICASHIWFSFSLWLKNMAAVLIFHQQEVFNLWICKWCECKMSFSDLYAKYNCTYCQEEINGVRVRCAECKDFDICLQVNWHRCQFFGANFEMLKLNFCTFLSVFFARCWNWTAQKWSFLSIYGKFSHFKDAILLFDKYNIIS